MILSRILPVLKNNNFPSKLIKIQYAAAATTPAIQGTSAIVEGPERDLINFPRPKREIYGGKVRMGFIPDEWFQFFYKKTGVTGPYVLGTGMITFLLSKEIYVLEHEFYNGVVLFGLMIYVIKKYGAATAETLDKWIAEYENVITESKEMGIESLNKQIEMEKKEQWHIEGQKHLFEAKRENIALQLETEYRKRMSTVYDEVKKRMDYHLTMITVQRQAEHKHMVNWITDQVFKSISPQQEAEALKKCISDLKVLSASA